MGQKVKFLKEDDCFALFFLKNEVFWMKIQIKLSLAFKQNLIFYAYSLRLWLIGQFKLLPIQQTI
ncbi:hypothetical protein BKI52_10425 [marine bacterium AO1-C]|nr:hypothetical protein BKI52_10425 [marine bacterium AO1-C]